MAYIDADASLCKRDEPRFHGWNALWAIIVEFASRTAALRKLKQSITSVDRLIVVGAGSESISVKDYPDACFIAADGAVGALDDLSSVLCVVSDGDGAEHLERAAHAGVHIVLHAHGDNLERGRNLFVDGLNLNNLLR